MLKITIKIQENKGKENAKMTISYPNKEEYEKATKIAIIDDSRKYYFPDYE